MPPVDLAFARLILEELVLLDRCTVTRYLPGPRKAVFNDATGHYEDVNADSIILEVDVPCKLRAEADEITSTPGRQREVYWLVTIAYGHLDGIEPGDIMKMTQCEDPRMLEDEYAVTEVVEQ